MVGYECFLERWHNSAYIFRITRNSSVDCIVIDAVVSGCPKKKFGKNRQRTNTESNKKIEAAQIWAILALVTSFTVFSPILFGIISTVLFAQAKALGVDAEYYKKKRRITRIIYIASLIIPLLIVIAIFI